MRREGGFGPPPPPFRIRRRRGDFSGFGSYNRWIALGVLLILAYIILSVFRDLYVNWLWFDGVGFRSIYSKELTTRVWLFFGGAAVFLVYFGANVWFPSRSALRRGIVPIVDVDAASLCRLYLLAIIATS